MHCLSHGSLLIEGATKLFKVWGVYRVRETPVPIPNTEAKPHLGDGTARESVWESSMMPQFIWPKRHVKRSCLGLFYFKR